MNNFLNFLNGYKTMVGLVLLIGTGSVCLVTGLDLPNFEEPGSWAEIAKWAGLLFSFVITEIGFFDKIAKTRAKDVFDRLMGSFPSMQVIKGELDQLKLKYSQLEGLNKTSGAGGGSGTAQSGQVTGTEQ